MPRRYLPTARTVTIANGGTESDGEDISGLTVVGVLINTALTGATVALQANTTNTPATYRAVKDRAGAAVTVTGAVGAYYLPREATDAWTWVRLVSAGAEAAERTITLLVKPLE